MNRELESIFAELGLSQYLDAFIEQGFDAWDTILDIQESDLDALGVKLGHRRKLQRRIANARGIAPSVSLASPLRANSDDGKQDVPPDLNKTQAQISDGSAVIPKRKYRRHPKPDENAPERPPSAYVLFSNKMREDLKSQNLSFTEIAKLVGENWQSLAPAEKDAYDSQANAAKERYHADLAEYKKTPEYRRYTQYLQEFKEKQAKQSQAQDATKRAKLEPLRVRHSSSSSNVLPNGTPSINGGGSGSGSEKPQECERPPSSRQQRVNSTTSLSESQQSSSVPTPMSQRNSLDEPGPSPRSAHFEFNNPREPLHRPARRQPLLRESTRSSETSQHQLPPLSDVLDDDKRSLPPDTSPYTPGFVAANCRRPVPDGHASLSSARRPLLQHEGSSNGSMASGSSGNSHGRSEGPLPIHALLSTRPVITTPSLSTRSVTTTPSLSYDTSSPSSVATAMTSPAEQGKAHFGQGQGQGPRGYGFQSATSAFQHMKVEQSGDGDVLMTNLDYAQPEKAGGHRDGLDGMSALLRAGEMVQRHGRDGKGS